MVNNGNLQAAGRSGNDSNILVRFLIANDKNQYQLALDYIRKQAEIFISKTVMYN